jgi:predicted RNA-binding Zn ribbon-like protein
MVNNRDMAPGGLELARHFLNTWIIANQTRLPEDRLPTMIKDAQAWRRAFGVPCPRTEAEREVLFRLRTDLRQMLAPARLDTEVLNGWIDRVPVKPKANADGVVHEPAGRSLAGLILASVIDALAAGQWARLKACHDCQWVFYDWTRNSSRRWCGMNAEGPEGRACGSIAKVRRYRQRQRTAGTSA